MLAKNESQQGCHLRQYLDHQQIGPTAQITALQPPLLGPNKIQPGLKWQTWFHLWKQKEAILFILAFYIMILGCQLSLIQIRLLSLYIQFSEKRLLSLYILSSQWQEVEPWSRKEILNSIWYITTKTVKLILLRDWPWKKNQPRAWEGVLKI